MRIPESARVAPAALRIVVVGRTLILVTLAPERRSIWMVRVDVFTLPTMPVTSSVLPVAVDAASAVGEPPAGGVAVFEEDVGWPEEDVVVADAVDLVELLLHAEADAAISAKERKKAEARRIGRSLAHGNWRRETADR